MASNSHRGPGLRDSPKLSKSSNIVKGNHITAYFFKRLSFNKIPILMVYINDKIVTGNYNGKIARLKEVQNQEFEVKDLRSLRTSKGINISQRKYILDLLKETGILGCKPIDTLMDPNKKIRLIKLNIIG